jgi:GT2 family glycosyltransferase
VESVLVIRRLVADDDEEARENPQNHHGMKLSIIIVHYRTRGLLKHCLQGLLDAKIGVEHEIIVADNASKDGTKEMCARKFPSVRFLENAVNIGFGRANNAAMKEARGEYFVILNPDTCIFPGQFEKVLAYAESHPDVGVVGAKLMNPDGTTQTSCYRSPKWFTPLTRRMFFGNMPFGKRENARFLMTDFDRKETREVDWVQGSFMCVPRRVVDEVGGFDDRYFMYFEDIDWCRRIRASGRRVVYFPEAAFIHYHRRESDGGGLIQTLRRKTARYHIASWIQYVWKWRGQKSIS